MEDRPRIVSWNVTGACNLRCPHCYLGAGRPWANELTTEEGLRLIDQMAEGFTLSGWTVDFGGVCFTPTLRDLICDFGAFGGGESATITVTGSYITTTETIITNTVLVYLGNGDGTFKIQQSYTVGRGTHSVTVSDMNTDGFPDIVVASSQDDTFSILFGNGDGTFQARQIYNTGLNPRSMSVSDINGDEIPDVLTVGWESRIHLGNGDGTFQSPRVLEVTGRQVKVADVNADGFPDAIVANFSSGISILLGNGDGTFQEPQTFAAGSGGSFAVSDFNEDGLLDMVAIHGGRVSILLQQEVEVIVP